MKVPFVDLTATTNLVKKGFLAAVEKLLEAGHFILTSEVKSFEDAWAKYLGRKYCVGVSSGADALYLSLTALGIREGDEVITQGNAYNACITAILRAGAVPRFADISEQTLTIDPEKIEPLINDKTRAIMPVHPYGTMADMPKIMATAQKYNLKVIEDCAQAHGAEFAG